MSSTFIDEFLRHTSIYESPGSFWRWSAYVTIAATLKDKFYIRDGDDYLFPNIYVLFLAESSGHRKDRPIKLSSKLVNKLPVPPKVIQGRSSVEAIMDELARTETDQVTGKVIKTASAVMYAPELAAGIAGDTTGLKILTDIYDYKPDAYKQRLRTGPCFNLERIVFSSLSATNQDMIQGFFNASEIKGGYLARTCLVTPNEERPPNSLLRVDHEQLGESFKCVQLKLNEIGRLNGQVKLSEEAIDEYETWYTPFRKDYLRKKETTGVVGRIHTTILKLAIILAANDLELTIRRKHMEQAIEHCLTLIPNYGLFAMGHAKTDIGKAAGLIISKLTDIPSHSATRKYLIRELLWETDAELLDKASVALEQGGMIVQGSYGSEITFTLSERCKEMMGIK